MTTDGVHAAPLAPAPASARRTPRWLGRAELIALLMLAVVGGIARSRGFTSLDLWFDDAWAAAPARVGLGQAVHMVLTSPGYGLALRSWVRLDPGTTWFAQLPAFVLGLSGIPAAYLLLRWFRSPRGVALAGAAVVAVGPITVQYSTRLKEYPFDLLAACALLALAEGVRRRPSGARLGWLCAASVGAFFVSAGCAPVIAGVWAGLAIALWATPAHRSALVASLAGVAAGCFGVWVVFLREIPAVLTTNWRLRGYLLDFGSRRGFERTVTMVLGGFVHSVLGYPVPASFFRETPGAHAVSAAVFGAALLGVAIAVPITASVRARRIVPAAPAALSLFVAVALAVAGRVPLGDGRTDEVLYPALLVCLAAAAAAVAPPLRRAAARGARLRAGSAVLSVALFGGVRAYGIAHPATYPTISLRGVEARLAPLERSGDVVFVDTFNSFGWCYYGLSACRTQVGGVPVWPQGFRPVSVSPSVFIAQHYGIPLPELTTAQAHATRIWYVGYTYGTFDVGSDPALHNVPVATFMTGLLARDGWRPARPGPRTVVFAAHAYAQLLVRSSPGRGHPGRAGPSHPG